MEASHASGVQLVDLVGHGGHLFNRGGQLGGGREGQLGGRRGVGLLGLELRTDGRGVSQRRVAIVANLGPVLGQPHGVAADGCRDVPEAVLLDPLGERAVSLVQAAAITEGFTDVTPRLALLGGGGLDVGPGALATEDDGAPNSWHSFAIT